MRLAITGANSSVGKILLRHVADRGDLEARAGVRRRQVVAELPSDASITPCVVDYDDATTLASLLEGVSCVVHLAGILIESHHSNYETANVAATRAVVSACRLADVHQIVFTSSLGADETSRNRYYRSKGLAEQLIARSGLPATIIRTSILLGVGTAGAASLVAVARSGSARVLGGGHHALRPLDVDDLATAILNCCRTPAGGVTIHELAGPESVTHRDLIIETGRRLGQPVSVGAVPIWAAKLGAAIAGRFRRGGMTPTVIDVITADEVIRENADAALGVSLTPLSETLEKLLVSTRNRVRPEGTAHT